MTQRPFLPSGGTPGPSPGQGGVVVKQPMGSVTDQILPDITRLYNREFKKRAAAGMFASTVSKDKPFLFDVGSDQVPDGQVLFLTDYQIFAGRFSGVAADDTTRLENDRFGTCWSFDLSFNVARPFDVVNEIDPVPIQVGRGGFVPKSGTRTGASTVFSNAAVNNFGASTGAGRSALPFRDQRFGPRQGPWSFLLPRNTVFGISGAIFKPLPVPIAYVAVVLAGYLVPERSAEAFQKMVQP